MLVRAKDNPEIEKEEIMASRAKISAAEFVQDLRSGLTACELMDKYSLVARELDGVLDQLKKTLGDPAEIYGRTGEE